MAFDNSTRNRLQRLVSDCRDLLTREFDAKLKELYGIYADEGRVLAVEKLHLDDEKLRVATLLRERISHLASGAGGSTVAIGEAVKRVLREQAFTVLNRFAALRMAEERGIIVESVGGGLNSKGFKTYSEVAHSGLGSAYERYRVFLGCMFDEMATDLGVLFDRRSPYGLLFPRENVLLEIFGLLNAPEVKLLWKEDETVGWIYQYFNDPTERKKMRELSAAPRSSRELAVRNQFFTPRYVVEFLTDNTLGRIWYEMCSGDTSVKERCRYLVRRPNEILLKPGEVAPAQPKQDCLSQEELLKQPVFIPHRPIKDPRTILMLDPACGSMHFGLYAFDLYEIIYDEAWELEGVTGTPSFARPAEMKSLRETFATKEEFLRQVPRLIIEHNLHGIDIDPRCAQIAGLSLWLRAQKSWQQLGLKPADRPRITRSNIVCAEPMPGEKELLCEFVEKEFPAAERGVFLQLLETIFDKMQLAGEAGSLLRIEAEISNAIAEAKQIWNAGQKLEQNKLFSETGRVEQKEIKLDLSGITDGEFWERVEERIYAALRDYAEQTENGGGFQRQLFAEDAARGFAFIAVCRKRYDVVGMNPPFGEWPESCEKYFQTNFPETFGDLFAMFFERELHVLNERGKMGAITNRTWLSLPTLEGVRTKVFGSNGCVEVAADLGSFVLDAQVETAAAIIGRDAPAYKIALWVRLLKTKAKNQTLLQALESASHGQRHDSAFVASQQQFLSLPASVYGYWMSKRLISLYRQENSVGVRAAEVKQGTSTADDFRFLRLAWELEPSEFGFGKRWLRFAKGGEYTPFFDDVHLALFWKDNGEEIVAWGCGAPRNTQYFGRSGVTWPRRTTSPFGPRPLPGGCAFGDKGPVAFPTANVNPNLLLGLLVSRPARLLLSVRLGAGDDAPGSASKSYEVGLIRDLPFPSFSSEQSSTLEQATARCVSIVRSRAVEDDETTCYFICPSLATAEKVASIRTVVASMVTLRDERFVEVCRLSSLIDEMVCAAFGFSETDRLVMCEELELPVTAFDPDKEPDLKLLKKAYLTKDAIDGEALPGGVEAELDVRVLTRRKQQMVLRDEIKICRLFEISPQQFASTRQKLALLRNEDLTESIVSLMQYLLGCAFGRWDIRYATGEQPVPELPDPFAPLPACPPGQLQNAQGLPVRPEDVPVAYPLKNISWAGILVDDESHQCDLVACVREVIEIIWTGRAGSPSAEAIEHEACEILGVKLLRDYFRKPTGFFADHLKRYSKSRRQAPIYWPLATASGSYTLWIYYHRLTDQTLFQCVNDFVKPKIAEVAGDLSRFTTAGADKPGARSEIERLTIFRAELVEFRDELLRVAQLPYKPNLNDGVLITASPLWKLFRLPKWQKDLKACWTALENEEYEWAHLAYTLWPDRVKAVCKKDRSIAIAHGLEALCEVKVPEKKAKPGKKKADSDLALTQY